MSETNNQAQSEQLTVSQEQLDVLDQLLKPEVQESLTTLVEQLPKLTEMMTLLTKSYEFAQAVATVGSAKQLAATAIEAKDRASESNEVIGLFGLVKMIKDPQVQNVFRFVNAFLQVNAERKSK